MSEWEEVPQPDVSVREYVVVTFDGVEYEFTPDEVNAFIRDLELAVA
jgi:hypothetical protein